MSPPSHAAPNPPSSNLILSPPHQSPSRLSKGPYGRTNGSPKIVNPRSLARSSQSISSQNSVDKVARRELGNSIRKRREFNPSPVSRRSYSDPEHFIGMKRAIITENRSNNSIFMVKTWSCPTIACTIRSSITPPVRQEFSCNSFNQEEYIVYNVDIARNVAIVCSKSEPHFYPSLQNLYHLTSASLPNIHLALDEDKIPISCEEHVYPAPPLISLESLASKLAITDCRNVESALKIIEGEEDNARKLSSQACIHSEPADNKDEEEDEDGDERESEEEVEVLEIVEYTEKRCNITAEELERCASSHKEDKKEIKPANRIFYNGKQEKSNFNLDKSNGLEYQPTSSFRPHNTSDITNKNLLLKDSSRPDRCDPSVILPKEVVPSIQR